VAYKEQTQDLDARRTPILQLPLLSKKERLTPPLTLRGFLLPDAGDVLHGTPGALARAYRLLPILRAAGPLITR
jgi:hypothetical protein